MKAEDYIKSTGLLQQIQPIYSSKNVIELMTQFAKFKCKEQREICKDEFVMNFSSNRHEDNVSRILNAPEPEL